MSSASEQQTSVSLLVFSTERQIHAFDLSHTFRVAIGRHESNDLQLDSRTVSKHHAEVLNENGKLAVRDLGSTNGTFLNDERIRERSVKSGDRIRIGSHVLTLHLEAPLSPQEGLYRIQLDPESFGPGTSGNIVSLKADSKDVNKTLHARTAHDLSFADLLKILSRGNHSVLVSLRSERGEARVWLQNGSIVRAEYGSARGEKALYRIFSWGNAVYEVKSFPDGPSPRSITLPADMLIVEGMKHATELTKLVAHLPPPETTLRLKEDCPLAPGAFTPTELEIYQAVIRYQAIATVVQESPLTDVRVLRLIDALLRKGVFEVTGSPERLGETYKKPANEKDATWERTPTR